MDKLYLGVTAVIGAGVGYNDVEPASINAFVGATAGTILNVHEKISLDDGLFRGFFNYYGFKNDKPRMAAAFGVGFVLGTLAGEFTRMATGSIALGNIVATPLSYCTSAIISATAADNPTL